jgi:PAS domain S-box-containing protein
MPAEARQREEALRASEEKLSRIVETIGQGIVILDRKGRFTYANAVAERILGLPRDEIVRRTYNDLGWKPTTVDGRPIAGEDVVFVRVVRTGRPEFGAEFAIEKPGGARVILSANVTPLHDPSGQVAGVVASLDDLTERRRLERVRDEFLSTAAHELKTPVATIKGYAQLLQQWAPGGHEPREARAFEVINRQSDRLNRLVQGLLEFARLQQRRFELRPQSFDLGGLASEVVARMDLTTPAHHLILHREPRVPVVADPDRIDEVLTNLLDNAIKASPKGGEIETRVYRQDREAVVSVTDWGVGIPPEKQPHIFERFYQAHAGPPYYRGGMGMGLYLNREIVARHGGRMWFTSAVSRGSTFYFSLPLAEEGSNGSRS